MTLSKTSSYSSQTVGDPQAAVEKGSSSTPDVSEEAEIIRFSKEIKSKNEPDPDDDKKEEGKKDKKKDPQISIYQLFRFATPMERLMVCISLVFSAGTGAMMPVSVIVLGNFMNNIGSYLGADANQNTDHMLDTMLPIILTFVYMGVAVLFAAYTANCFWIITGENQTQRIREMYLHSILRQDMSWQDTRDIHEKQGSLTTRLASDTQLIQDGISEKFGLFVASIAQFISGFIVAFVKGPLIAAIVVGSTVAIGVVGATMVYFMKKLTAGVQDAYADAGAVAEQVFHGIRTVYSFSLQERFAKRYEQELVQARKVSLKRGVVTGGGFATFMLLLFCTYGLAFWFGGRQVMYNGFPGGNVLVVLFSMIMGAMAILQIHPNLSAISTACGAAYKIYSVIERVPAIDIDNENGLKLDAVKGDIEFRDVVFRYPSRPDVPILKKLSVRIKPGMTVAFVGPSGSGKSTSVSLIQRFYDPLEGQILLDDHDIKDLDVKWLRSNIGVVSQEPVLFNTSIRKNILLGVDHDVSDEELISACKKANCHAFIENLPKGYDTLVGEHGGMLSGGQKQRIAIARAILKNPPILLLDEATSALDTQSERLVQNALNAASKDRTTIVIAHRLSTIREADLILVLSQGEVVEMGDHNSLVDFGGQYADLVKKQEILTEKRDDSPSQEVDDEELMRRDAQDLKEQIDIRVVTDDSQALELSKTISRSSEDGHERKLRKEREARKAAMKQSAPVRRVVMDMKPEWRYILVGVLGALVAGVVFPAFALILSRVVSVLVLSAPQDVAPGPVQGANLYAFLFVMIGIGSFLSIFLQVFSFEAAGAYYTERLRGKVFRAIMRQEIGYFDHEDNSSGALISRLATDALNVNELVAKTWGDIAQITSTLITGLVIAFVNSWKLTLVILAVSPFIVFANAHESRAHRGFEDKTKKANEQSGEVASEAIKEIRTVASLNKQGHFEERYTKAMSEPHRLAVRKAIEASLGYALHQGIMYFTNAISFYAGVRFIMDGSLQFQAMFTTMMAIMITAQGVGRSSVFAATFAKAKFSSLAIFEILDRTPSIDADQEGIIMDRSQFKGDFEFKNINFRYPSRPNVSIFSGDFNLKGDVNQTVALVGPSGCGKSTTIGMLQRWYDPFAGSVRVDDHDVKNFSLQNLRSHMALVGQEPILFDMSIRDNVCFGVDNAADGVLDEKKAVSEEDIEAACKAANIHKFISSLPQAYETRVGDKASQLSGGQKQRIAIARALIRKPRILLLDEATSALDSDSEKIVQAAIDNIIEEGGRTTITIAHRLSTIQNADVICVINGGRVVEQGTHWELLKLNGIYADLVHQQSLAAD